MLLDNNPYYILKDASSSGFQGESMLAPEILNEGTTLQPHLSKDYNTIYWASSEGPGILSIWKADRIGEFEFGNEEAIISSDNIVGEFSITDDGSRIYFLQVFESLKGEHTSDIFYAEKV